MRTDYVTGPGMEVSARWSGYFENGEEKEMKKMNKIELKPCPFCGKTDTLTIVSCVELGECRNFERCKLDSYKTICCDVNKGGCGATSGYTMDESLIIKNWNRRAGNETD